jgi:hypothetical protein
MPPKISDELLYLSHKLLPLNSGEAAASPPISLSVKKY